jgi:hypothetical protein
MHISCTDLPDLSQIMQQGPLPLINSVRCELLDQPRFINQLCNLEGRTARGGRDSIDHRPNGHDDTANCVAGVLVLAGVVKKQVSFVSPFGASQPHFFPGSDSTAWARGPPGWPRNGGSQ